MSSAAPRRKKLRNSLNAVHGLVSKTSAVMV